MWSLNGKTIVEQIIALLTKGDHKDTSLQLSNINADSSVNLPFYTSYEESEFCLPAVTEPPGELTYMTMSCKIYNMSLQKYPGKWLWNKPHTFHDELGRLDKVKK